MKKRLLFAVLCIAASINVFAEANYVYHERTTNNPGCGPNYVSKLAPTSTDAVVLAFKIEYQFYTNQARVYYTTDGSTPAGSYGNATGSTQVITASYNCTFSSGGTVDVVTATIPAQAAGTTIKYIVSAWNSGGGSEIFGNGPGSPCNCGTPTNTSSLATVFSYNVSAVLPITFGQIIATQKTTGVLLDWQILSQSNISTYVIEKSTDGVSFNVVNSQINTNLYAYTWLDAAPVNGNNFYRIKALGKDGEATYSSVVKVNTFNANAGISIFPNPIINNNIHLQIDNLPADSYTLNIFNQAGQSIYSTKIQYAGGNNSQTIVPPTNMAKGVYQLSVKGSQGNYIIKFFVQ